MLRAMCRWTDTARKSASLSRKRTQTEEAALATVYLKETAVNPRMAGFGRVERRVWHQMWSRWERSPMKALYHLSSLSDHFHLSQPFQIFCVYFILLLLWFKHWTTESLIWIFRGVSVASLSLWFPITARQMLLSNEGMKCRGMPVHLSAPPLYPDWKISTIYPRP